MDEDQFFDVLISPSDFYNLQSRCQELEAEKQKLIQEKSGLDINMLEMTNREIDFLKKIKKLEENNKYLSIQGIKIAKAALEASKRSYDVQQGDEEVQTNIIQHGGCEKCQKLKEKYQFTLREYSQSKQMYRNTELSFNQKQSMTETQLTDMLQENRKLTQKCSLSQAKCQALEKYQQQKAIKMKDLQICNEALKQRVDELNLQLSQQKKQNNELNQQLKISNKECEKLMNQIYLLNGLIGESQRRQKQGEIQKNSDYVPASQFQAAKQEVKSYELALQGLNKELFQMEKIIKEKDDLIKFYSQQEKAQAALNKKLDSELNRLKESQSALASPMQGLKIKLEEYFTNFALKMCDSGGVKSRQIIDALKSQQSAIKKLVQHMAQTLIGNLPQQRNKAACFKFVNP